ncbi:GmrSD restriction endonuclease domain-containing protein [Thiohalorhabdus denitrificans]|uniref:GmrSD restriction endonucleases N-terminal domain-containing protein n=1 Tax=Thiohalorhabdus denitrificans TaxID=381306 RepID=A0A1G5GJE4_9GAMM|nr:DUF262 domain-containing protein [Thiohalorhabdus denitrificans]SCY51604.1 hypothetical protein SAMN05661077_2373 [Thiohalorhabdus denitrificans]
MDNFTIREILDAVYRGQIRIPAFQRGFVWEPDRVAFLIDSVYKNYPFGTLLFWRTNEQLKTERELGPFHLPEPNSDFPIDYVLDGQQRITSIFGVFQTELSGSSSDWKEIYYDFSKTEDIQETQFFALSEDEVDPSKHFPLSCIFNTSEYRKMTKEMDDDLAANIDQMQSVFKEARIPVQTFKTDEKEKVAIIFERINRQGVPLDTLQLLSAWTWSEDFQLQEQFQDLIDELNQYGFTDISNDISLLLRCTASVLTGSSRPESLVNLNGADVRARFDEVLNGIKGALDFIWGEYSLPTIENLPYHNIIVPLSVFFSKKDGVDFNFSGEQKEKLNRWFWRSSFSKRFSSGVLRNMDADIVEMVKLKEGASSSIDNISVSIDPGFFIRNAFQINSVSTKTFVAMLAQYNPKNFVSGTSVDLSEKLQKYNRKQFHHIMPKAFLLSTGQTDYNPNVLANLCFISAADNREIGKKAPSEYKTNMAGNVDEILESHLCPHSLFKDTFIPFVQERAEILAQKARELCEV